MLGDLGLHYAWKNWRTALNVINLTNHFNPEVVHANVADPAYGYFFGHRGRRFTVDFDFLF